MPRARGSKNRETLEREKAERIAAARAEFAKNAPAIDYAASYDSLDVMEKVVRHFYLRALIEQSMGKDTDWNMVDTLMMKALTAAKDVARYRHATLSAVRLAGDLTATMATGSLDEVIAKLKDELRALDPGLLRQVMDLGVPLGIENRLPITVTGEPEDETGGGTLN